MVVLQIRAEAELIELLHGASSASGQRVTPGGSDGGGHINRDGYAPVQGRRSGVSKIWAIRLGKWKGEDSQ